jgi:hypothetical protein
MDLPISGRLGKPLLEIRSGPGAIAPTTDEDQARYAELRAARRPAYIARPFQDRHAVVGTEERERIPFDRLGARLAEPDGARDSSSGRGATPRHSGGIWYVTLLLGRVLVSELVAAFAPALETERSCRHIA